MAIKRAQAKKKKPKLPPHVVVKFDPPIWFVKRHFPTLQRDKKGRIVYIQIVRKCEPPTPERAAAIRAQIEAEYKAIKSEQERTLSVGEFLAKFLETKRLSVARRTYEIAADLFERFVYNTTFSRIGLPKLKTMDVQRFYGHLMVKGSTAATIRKIHVNLSTAFNQAVKWESMPRNPCNGVLLPRSQRKETKSLTITETKAFIKACRTSDEYIIFEFALETGMRPGEYLALTWSDIDFNKRLVHVRRSVAQGMKGGGFEIKQPKTRTSVRTLVFSNELKKRLLRHKELAVVYQRELRRRVRSRVHLRHKKATGSNYKRRKTTHKVAHIILRNFEQYNLVFPSSTGLPRSKLNLNRRQFKNVLKRAGLDPTEYSLYSLRHTCCSLLLQAGANVKAVSEKLGHSNIQTTLNFYTHIFDDTKQDAAARLAEMLYAG